MITWYGWIISGFLLGTYIHSNHVRHWIHTLIVYVLRGIIWLLHKFDNLYEPPRQVITPVIKTSKDNDVEIESDELKRILKNNPELSVSKR